MFLAVPLQLKQVRDRDTLPLANSVLIALNVLVYALGLAEGWQVGRERGVLSIVTYAFAHANAYHLIGNMWVLWVFGNPVNRRLGNGYYALAYLGTAVTLGVFAWLFCTGGLLGASGAIFGVLAIAMLLMPAARIEVGYVALFPLTLLLGLLWRPRTWLFWLIRWDKFDLWALWGLVLVPLLEIEGLWWCGWNWTNLGHLLGFLCGVVVVLLLPTEISMNRRAVRVAT
jgi:membrane associated rhomboid family serine protease